MIQLVRITVLNALVAISIATSAFAYESPGKPIDFVSDYGELLTASEETLFNDTLLRFKEASGVEIAIATVPSLGGEVIEDYANELFREWGVGGKDANRGLLILIARDERGVRIEVGYGLEGEVPDAYASSIIRNTMIPAFKQGDYVRGLTDGVNALLALIESGEGLKTPDPDSHPFSFIEEIGPWFFFGYIVLSWAVAIMSRTREWWLGGVFGLLATGGIWYLLGSAIALAAVVPLVLIGLCIDYVVSLGYRQAVARGSAPPWWTGGNMGSGGGFGGRSGGGGFGGFGGGSSGGGGASGRF